MIRITIACPKALFDDYIALRRCLVPSRADADTPPLPDFSWQDGDAGFYAVSSSTVAPAWIEALQAPLVAPPWGADLAAAERARVRITPWPGTGAAPGANQNTISVVTGLEGVAALTEIGLVPVAGDALI